MHNGTYTTQAKVDGFNIEFNMKTYIWHICVPFEMKKLIKSINFSKQLRMEVAVGLLQSVFVKMLAMYGYGEMYTTC